MTDVRKPTVAHRIEQALFSSAVAISGMLGERASSSFGAAVGRLGYFPLRFRRQLVEKHLRIAFPDRDEAWIAATTRGSYEHLGREALATMRLGRVTREDIIDRTRVTGFDLIPAALAEGRGAVLVTGHVGNHEAAAIAVAARGISVDLVVQQQGNPLFNETLNNSRRRFGIGIIDRFEAQREAIRTLRAGRAVGFAADQNAGKSGVFVPFFGRLASTHRGPALFAVKMGAPLLLCTLLRNGDVYDGLVQRVDVDREGPLDEVVRNLTAAFTARLEEVVRSAPDQYLWLHRRWKTRPPEELSPYKQV